MKAADLSEWQLASQLSQISEFIAGAAAKASLRGCQLESRGKKQEADRERKISGQLKELSISCSVVVDQAANRGLAGNIKPKDFLAGSLARAKRKYREFSGKDLPEFFAQNSVGIQTDDSRVSEVNLPERIYFQGDTKMAIEALEKSAREVEVEGVVYLTVINPRCALEMIRPVLEDPLITFQELCASKALVFLDGLENGGGVYLVAKEVITPLDDAKKRIIKDRLAEFFPMQETSCSRLPTGISQIYTPKGVACMDDAKKINDQRKEEKRMADLPRKLTLKQREAFKLLQQSSVRLSYLGKMVQCVLAPRSKLSKELRCHADLLKENGGYVPVVKLKKGWLCILTADDPELYQWAIGLNQAVREELEKQALNKLNELISACAPRDMKADQAVKPQDEAYKAENLYQVLMRAAVVMEINGMEVPVVLGPSRVLGFKNSSYLSAMCRQGMIAQIGNVGPSKLFALVHKNPVFSSWAEALDEGKKQAISRQAMEMGNRLRSEKRRLKGEKDTFKAFGRRGGNGKQAPAPIPRLPKNSLVNPAGQNLDLFFQAISAGFRTDGAMAVGVRAMFRPGEIPLAAAGNGDESSLVQAFWDRAEGMIIGLAGEFAVNTDRARQILDDLRNSSSMGALWLAEGMLHEVVTRMNPLLPHNIVEQVEGAT